MFTGVRRESIRPFKSIGSFHSQVPALSHSRSGNRHAPLALWPTERVLIRGKGNQIEPLPCPQDVGEAVVAYLRRGRPATAADRSVFVRIRAPHRALSGIGVSGIVVAAARRAGIGEIRAHRLRQTVATQLLRAGSSLPEIGQLLRHRHISTTAVYAKVDRDALRSIARPWLGGAA